MKKRAIVAAIGLALGSQGALAADASVEQKIEILQQEIEALKAQLNTSAQPAAGAPAAQPQAAPAAAGPSLPGHSETVHWQERLQQSRTVIGGYGEINYNNYRDSSKNDVLDLKRFILFFGHNFNDWISLRSELEVEHAFVEGGEDSGEVAMEQAYLNFHFSDRFNLRTGLQLMPLGFLNETHEPPTYYGVERNEVETRIIPSTWRELAVGLQGEAVPGLEYNVGVSTAPDASKFGNPANGFRSMRQSGGQANANEFAVYGALNYRGLPGLLVGGGVFTGNTGGRKDAAGNSLVGGDARLTLWDLHAQYNWQNLQVRALYARGTLDDAGAISAATASTAPKAFYGWYVEPAYTVWRKGDMRLTPFARYERYNTQDEVAAGLVADPKNDERVLTYGASLYPTRNVVFKADYQDFDKDDAKDRFNLGVGYMF
ncbi:MAG: hypothetical protein ACOY5C_00555 [Pseudomonadota bacterium]